MRIYGQQKNQTALYSCRLHSQGRLDELTTCMPVISCPPWSSVPLTFLKRCPFYIWIKFWSVNIQEWRREGRFQRTGIARNMDRNQKALVDGAETNYRPASGTRYNKLPGLDS